MVQQQAEVFAALGHPTRMRVVAECSRGPRSTSQLQHLCQPITLTGMRKHLQVLEEAGMVRRRKVGRTVWCSIAPDAIDEASAWLNDLRGFWTAQLDSLSNALEEK